MRNVPAFSRPLIRWSIGFILFTLVTGILVPQYQGVWHNTKRIQTSSGAIVTNFVHRIGSHFYSNDFTFQLPGSQQHEYLGSDADPATSFDQLPRVEATQAGEAWTVTIGSSRYARLHPTDPKRKWVKVPDAAR